MEVETAHTTADQFPTRGARNICGDFFSQTDDVEELQRYRDIFMNYDRASYVITSVERGSRTGRIHVQFYMNFKNCIRLSTLKKELHPNAHFIACKGDPLENIAYVKKNRQIDIDLGIGPNTDVLERGDMPDGAAKRLEGMGYLTTSVLEYFLNDVEEDDEQCIFNLQQLLFELLDMLLMFDPPHIDSLDNAVYDGLCTAYACEGDTPIDEYDECIDPTNKKCKYKP